MPRVVCELSREQFEAALNLAKHLRQERAAGREIDVTRIRRVLVVEEDSAAGSRRFDILTEQAERRGAQGD